MKIEELVNDYGSYVYNYAVKLSGNPSAADDLCQETFINAWKSIDGIKNPDAVKSWLRKICFNNFLMSERKKSKKAEVLADEMDILEKQGKSYYIVQDDLADEILVEESVKEMQNGCFLAMAGRLTINQRIAFSLVDMFGLKLDEVAELLDISKSAVKGLLYRAHMNLDSFFYDHCSILDAKNPCRCKAWLEFAKRRENMQECARKNNIKLVETLDCKEKHYAFNKEIRDKINYLYKNIQDRKPDDDWYRTIITSIK